jgi:hypothetical protein
MQLYNLPFILACPVLPASPHLSYRGLILPSLTASCLASLQLALPKHASLHRIMYTEEKAIPVDIHACAYTYLLTTCSILKNNYYVKSIGDREHCATESCSPNITIHKCVVCIKQTWNYCGWVACAILQLIFDGINWTEVPSQKERHVLLFQRKARLHSHRKLFRRVIRSYDVMSELCLMKEYKILYQRFLFYV